MVRAAERELRSDEHQRESNHIGTHSSLGRASRAPDDPLSSLSMRPRYDLARV
jgi:hypothetical protein